MKDKLTQFYYTKLFWITILWYRITQFTTKLFKEKTPVALFRSSHQLGDYVKNNADYILDPFEGKLDILRHPAVVQNRIDKGDPAGDCDDHSALWLAALLKGGITQEVWLGVVWYKTQDDRREGHAVTVWSEDGEYFWADYGAPCGIDKIHMDTKWTWPNSVMKAGYGVSPLCATLTPVSVDDKDSLKFGKTIGQKY